MISGKLLSIGRSTEIENAGKRDFGGLENGGHLFHQPPLCRLETNGPILSGFHKSDRYFSRFISRLRCSINSGNTFYRVLVQTSGFYRDVAEVSIFA